MRSLDRLTERLHESPGQRRRCLHCDLLAEDGPQSQLESIEGAGHAKARVPCNGRGEYRVDPQMRSDYVGACAQIVSVPKSSKQCREHRRQGMGELYLQSALLRGMPDPNPSSVTAELHGAQVRIVLDALESLQLTLLQEAQHSSPIERRPICQLQREGGRCVDPVSRCRT